MERSRWNGKSGLKCDDIVEAKDCRGNWYEAVVIEMKKELVNVHFRGFSTSFDERVPMEHVRPVQNDWRSKLNVGTKVEALIDVTNNKRKRKRLWHLGVVVEKDEKNVLIQYAGTALKRLYRKDSDSLSNVHTHVKKNTTDFENEPSLIRFPRPCGLVNLGNTCYLNAALQILMHSNASLMNEILRCTSNCHVLKSVRELFNCAKVMTNKTRSRSSLSPVSIKETLDRRFSQFRGHEQQDAHEFLQCILNALHNDLRSGEKEKTGEGMDTVSPLQFWVSHTTCNRSIVQDQFEGLTTSLTTCPKCSFTRRTNEPFVILTLPIPAEMDMKKKNLRLEDCLKNLFNQNETLNEANSWHCERCDEDVLATRSTSIWYLPDTLVLCLKRFQGDKKNSDKEQHLKITSPINYPIRGLDMSKFWQCQCTKESRCRRVRCANAEDAVTKVNPVFDLCAVIEHKGVSVQFGHYTSTVKCGEKEKWYQCNDDRIRLINKDIQSSRDAYVLVYRRVGCT